MDDVGKSIVAAAKEIVIKQRMSSKTSQEEDEETKNNFQLRVDSRLKSLEDKIDGLENKIDRILSSIVLAGRRWWLITNHKLQITNFNSPIWQSWRQDWQDPTLNHFGWEALIANFKVQTTIYKIDGLENKIKRILSLTTFARSLILCTNYKLQTTIHDIDKLENRFIGLLFRSLWSEANYWLWLFPFYIHFQWHSLYCVKFWDSFIWLQGKTIDVDFSQQKLMKLHTKFVNYPFELSPFRESRCKIKFNHVMMAKMLLLNTLKTKQGIFISLIYLDTLND